VVQGLDAPDYLLVAEFVLGVEAERLARQADLGALDAALRAPFASWNGSDLYPSLAEKAAVLCSRLVRNRPLVDGNTRVAYLAMTEFIGRNGCDWKPPAADEAADAIERLAARELDEREFARWIAARLA
jgi:death on curing protein